MSRVNQYLSQQAVLFDLENQPKQYMGKGMAFQHLHTVNMTFVRWEFAASTVVSRHKHPSEQVTWFPKGRARVVTQSGDDAPEIEHIIESGQVLVIPSNVYHEFHILEDTIDIDIFTPVRQDWIDGTADYY